MTFHGVINSKWLGESLSFDDSIFHLIHVFVQDRIHLFQCISTEINQDKSEIFLFHGVIFCLSLLY